MDTIIQNLIEETGLSLWAYFGLCLSSFLASFISAAIGLGGGVLVLATMALVLPPPVLIPVHGVVQLGSNLGRALLLARQIRFAIVPMFVGGTLAGAIIGAHTVVALPTWILQVFLAFFILYATWMPSFQSHKSSPAQFLRVGAVTTFIGMFVGATGALVAPFVAAACPDRRQVVGTHALLMSIQNSFKVLVFGVLGFAFGAYIPLLIGLITFGFLGTYVGRLLLQQLPEAIFRIGLRSVLTVLVLRLLYTALFHRSA